MRPENLKQVTSDFDALHEEAGKAQDILAETFDGKDWAGNVVNPGIKGGRALQKLRTITRTTRRDQGSCAHDARVWRAPGHGGCV